MVITPWGSDVLRAKKYQLRGLRKLVQKSNWVTCTQGSRFEKDIVTLLDIPKEKLYNLPIGIASIDEILSRPFITDEQAKRVWGFEGKYVIVIGYNGSPAHKKDLLIHLLKNPAIKSVLIFTRTKYGADKLARTLSKSGIRAEAIHGNKSQNARQRALTGFKNHELRVLIATDIAARGIDVDQLSHVINYELPNIPETYVHRIGRTGRAGHDGIALSFCESEELPYLKDIQKLIGKSIPVIKEHPFVTADGLKAQKIKTEEIKAKTKENKIYRGSRTNGDFWRRKKQTSQNNTPKGVGR